jgi:ferredoxin-type protein NapG
MRRRRFIRNLFKAALLLAAAAIPYGLSSVLAPRDAAAKRNYRRPPGALADKAQFEEACIGCGLCGEVCPPQCIRFHARDGGGKVNTPYINPAEKACTLCDKCMDVCPTNALTPTPRLDIDMGIAQIDRTACYPWVDRGICGACVSICPIGAKGIRFKQWNQYQPIIETGCVGCGLCVEVCPHPSTPIWIVDRTEDSVVRKKLSS